MFYDEAKWWGEKLGELDQQYFPALNVNSTSEEYRSKIKPFINQFIFTPLKNSNKPIFLTAESNNTGADWVGNILDEAFRAHLKQQNIQTIICTHVLEHVENREAFCTALLDIIPSGGCLLVSCPSRYPYHANSADTPIDTMYRPSKEALAALFPGTTLIESAVFNDSIFSQMNIAPLKTPGYLLYYVLRLFTPFYNFKAWRYLLKRKLPYYFLFGCQSVAIILRKD